MIDPFLDEIFISNAIAAALGRNTTYTDSTNAKQRNAIRKEFGKQLRAEAARYKTTVSDDDHCRAITTISKAVSDKFEDLLKSGRLRYGTTQNAFNLYLKFLWRSGQIPKPPHCPIDRIVLSAAGISGSFTKCDSMSEYSGWIDALRKHVGQRSLAEWENDTWLEAVGDKDE
jgi:hypothetical protein